MVRFTPRSHYSQRKSPRYPLDTRLGGLQSPSGLSSEKNNFLLLSRIETRSSSPWPSSYTDWGTLPAWGSAKSSTPWVIRWFSVAVTHFIFSNATEVPYMHIHKRCSQWPPPPLQQRGIADRFLPLTMLPFAFFRVVGGRNMWIYSPMSVSAVCLVSNDQT